MIFPTQSSVLDEQALLEQVVSQYAIDGVQSCEFASRGDSDIYRVASESSIAYLKINRPPRTRIKAEAEALLVRRLAEAGHPVVLPIPRRDGSFASEVTAYEGKRAILLFEEAPPALPAKPDAEILHQLGALVAGIHETIDCDARDYDLPIEDIDAMLAECVPYIRRFMDEADAVCLEEAIDAVHSRFASIPREVPQWGVCHADLVISNVRMGENGPVLFDFGNAAYTWRGFDLSIVHWSLSHRFEAGLEFDSAWKTFLRGYGTTRELPAELEANLRAFLVYRELMFLGGNALSLPLRLGTEPFESSLMRDGFNRIRELLE